MAVIEPDTAFWALVRREQLAELALGGPLAKAYPQEGGAVRRGNAHAALRPEALGGLFQSDRALQPQLHLLLHSRGDAPQRAAHVARKAARCPGDRSSGYFRTTLPKGTLPQIIFHGAEPLLNREAVFAGIEQYADDFRFGIQTNATLLDEPAIEFLRGHDVSIGISLDAPTAAVADRTRKNWDGQGVYAQVLEAMERLQGYPAWSVICTISSENLRHLTGLVDFLHAHEVPTCLMNILRCTLPRSRGVKPDDAAAAQVLLAALDRTRGAVSPDRPQAGGGQFRQHPAGDRGPGGPAADVRHFALRRRTVFLRRGPQRRPVPLQRVHRPGAVLRRQPVPRRHCRTCSQSAPFQLVTGRKVEDIEPCRRCAIRHFCGSPCPAEAHEMNGGMEHTGAFCEFYEEQVRYAFRLIADERLDDFLWDDWDQGMRQTFAMS